MEEAKKIAKESKSSFYYAFNLLPQEKREAMNAIYAFCRKSDDIVDEDYGPDSLKYENLRKWRIELENALRGKSNYALLNKVVASIQTFNIPVEPFFDLIKGMEIDLQRKRFESFEDLKDYCYKVASTVGLMTIEIFGYKYPSTKEFAVNLGLALQLTNILRDVKKDAANGRIYLPAEDLERFNYSEIELLNNVYNENFKELMRFQAQRARGFYNAANNALKFEDKPSLFAARAMQHIYYSLLEKLERSEFDVYNNEINVSRFKKVSISLGVWLKYSLVY